ncbi:MAG: type II toxin-antitoxin system RelE/ParE family toxin [Terasakiella sp.]|uniref:type II toxin-antitoxin system RelE/ParE family toxin n=1 Tax=unclassified Terasakiella TaxID=2614952 RepID=UPI003B00B0C9
MTNFRLTKAAAEDFESIFEFSIDHFGKAQAVKYANGLKMRFSDITNTPKQYPAVDHIAPDYRRSVYGSHAIYYRIETDYILIVRILGQQDVGASLP